MPNPATYEVLIEALTTAGVFTSLRGSGEQAALGCASRRYPDGSLGGRSLVVVMRKNRWYLSAWGDSIALCVPNDRDLVPIILEALRVGYDAQGRIPKSIGESHGLIVVQVDPEVGVTGDELM